MEKPICDLYCIVEGQFFYFNLLSVDDQLVVEDIVVVDNGLNLFERPDIISSFFKESFSKYQLNKVFFCLVQMDFTIVPELISNQEIQHWLPQYNGYLLVDTLDEIKIAYYVSKLFYDHLAAKFEKVQFSHVLSINLCNQTIENGVQSLAINGYRFISIAESKKLVFANLYECNSMLGNLYYTLMPYQLKDSDTENTPLYYLSDRNIGPPVSDVKKYVRHVETVDITNARDTLLVYQSLMLDKLIKCVS